MAGLPDLPRLAARISAALDDAGIEHVISGATAMAAHGFVRATQDLDILVVAPQVRLPTAFALIRDLGFEGDDADLLQSLREHHVASLVQGPLRVEILVPALPYHNSLVSRSVRIHVAGGTIPVVSIEDLVILKILWHRAKDVADVHALLALSGEAFDREYARTALASILPADDPRHAELEALLARFT